LLAIERERLVDRLREDAQHWEPTQRAIDAALSERAEVRAERKAIENRLDKIRRQVGAAASLKKQNVIYEDGVYTEQLLQTLKRTQRDVRKELTSLSQEEERIDQRLSELNQELAERQRKHQAELRQQLEKHRSTADAVLAQIEELEAQVAVVNLNATATGLFEPNPALRLGGHVAREDAIGALLVPSDKGIVESQVSAQESKTIRVGQPVRVTLQHVKQDTRLRLHGRVVSLVSDASDSGPGGGQHRVRIEIDVPLHGNRPASGLSAGMPGSITIITGGEPIWRYTWRMVNTAGANGFIDFDQS
jgi:membrane fusion protein